MNLPLYLFLVGLVCAGLCLMDAALDRPGGSPWRFRLGMALVLLGGPVGVVAAVVYVTIKEKP